MKVAPVNSGISSSVGSLEFDAYSGLVAGDKMQTSCLVAGHNKLS
jgi:hypothetical protein